MCRRLTCKTAQYPNNTGKTQVLKWQEIQGYQDNRENNFPLIHRQKALEQQLHGVGEEDDEGHTGGQQFQGEQNTSRDTGVPTIGNESEVGKGDQAGVEVHALREQLGRVRGHRGRAEEEDHAA